MREHFNQSYKRLSHGDSIFSKPNCLVVKSYFLILYSAQLAISIFKINFSISTFHNFLKDAQLKWFYFKHHSRTTKSVLMAIIFWQTKQNHFELSAHAESDSMKIYKFFIPYKVWYGIEIRFKFSFVTSTPFSTFFVVDVETTQAKIIFSFLALFNLMNGTIIFFVLFLSSFFEDGRPTTINSAPFGLPLF